MARAGQVESWGLSYRLHGSHGSIAPPPRSGSVVDRLAEPEQLGLWLFASGSGASRGSGEDAGAEAGGDRGGRLRDKLVLLIATAGGAGYAPVAPGTWGSAVGVALYLGLAGLGGPGFCAVVFATTNVVGGYLVTHRMLAMFRKKD